MTKGMFTIAAVALALGLMLGRATAPGAPTAHAQPQMGKRLVSIAVEAGAIYKAYDDDTISVCSPTPAGIGCRPLR